MSSSIAFRRSPKPGALIARQFRLPLSLFTTNVASASPSTSSAIITTFLVTGLSFSSMGTSSVMDEIFSEVMSM